MKQLIFSLLAFCLLQNMQGQKNDFENFVQDLKSKGIEIYYGSEESLPSISAYQLEEGRDTLEQLNKIIAGSGFGFMKYSDDQYILLPDALLKTKNTKQFIQNNNAAKNAVIEESVTIIGNRSSVNLGNQSKISGRVTEEATGEPVIGATIIIEPGSIGTTTDVNGDYEIQTPTGEYTIKANYIGLETDTKKIQVYSSGNLDFKLAPESVTLKEIIVSDRRAQQEFENDQVGLQTISVEQIQSTSSVLGEADVVRTIVSQTGVSSIGDGAGGFNVRGGNVDENLILQDEVIIFNSSHALGFYSIFNQDFISSVDLYKGNMPAMFGGRVASAMQVSLTDRATDVIKIKGGVGPIASRIMTEIPVTKGGALLFGGRLSYGNYILKLIDNEEVTNSTAGFYDVNAIYTQRINDNIRLKLSHYRSHDDFEYNKSFGFDYNTIGSQADVKYNIAENIISTTSAVLSDYISSQSDLTPNIPFEVNSKIHYLKIKETVSYLGKDESRVDGGISYLKTRVSPGESNPIESNDDFEKEIVPDQNGIELSAFIQGNYEFLDRIGLNAGLRFTSFRLVGEGVEYEYSDNDPVNGFITGSKEYGAGEKMASYSGLEPRLSLRIGLNDRFSLKGGYSRAFQYINQIYNSDTPTPISVWQFSNRYLKPKKADNFSVGLFSLWEEDNIESSLEVFYRTTKNLYDYKDFADLVLNPHLETEVLGGQGRAQGIEFSVKRNFGEFTGQINYTYSRSERKIDGINNDEWYLSNFDKTNDLLLVLNYNPNIRSRITLNYAYSTGRPITAPIGTYLLTSGHFITVYDKRNGIRIPDYHRLDIAYTIGKSYKKEKKFKTSWTLGIYNVLGIKNPYSVFYTRGAFGLPQANKLVILGAALPSISFNFTFN